MRQVRDALMATTLLVAAAGCSGESSTVQEGQIIGFAQGIDGQILEDQWVPYSDMPYLPGGQIRNVDTGRRFTGCLAVNDQMFSWNVDDSDCWLAGCGAGDGQHCKAQYHPVYSYEQLEERVVQDCPALLTTVKREFKSNEVAEDTDCLSSVRLMQRIRKAARYVIWFRTPNPEYEEDKQDETRPEPEVLIGSTDITASEWAELERDDPVLVTIKGGRITDASLK